LVRERPFSAALMSEPALARWMDAQMRRAMAARFRRPVIVCADHFVK